MKDDHQPSAAIIQALRKCDKLQIDVHIVYRLPILPFIRGHALYMSFTALPRDDIALAVLLNRLIDEATTPNDA